MSGAPADSIAARGSAARAVSALPKQPFRPWCDLGKLERAPSQAVYEIEATLPESVKWENHREYLKQCADDDTRWRCEVCMGDESVPGNLIIICEGCFMCAHQLCYGVVKVPSGDFYCQLCASGNCDPPPRCLLCPNRGGAMKRVRKARPSEPDNWAHLSCALWLQPVVVADPDYWEDICARSTLPSNQGALVPLAVLAEEAAAVQNTSKKDRRQCKVCRGSGGVLTRCSATGCSQWLHVTCAQRAGMQFRLRPPAPKSPSSRASKAPEPQLAAGLEGLADVSSKAVTLPPPSSSSSSSSSSAEAAQPLPEPTFDIFCNAMHPLDSRRHVPRSARSLGLTAESEGLSPADPKTLTVERQRLAEAATQDEEEARWEALRDDALRPFPQAWEPEAVREAAVRCEALFLSRTALASGDGRTLRRSLFAHDLELFHLAYGHAPLPVLAGDAGGLAVHPGGPPVDLYRLYTAVRAALQRVQDDPLPSSSSATFTSQDHEVVDFGTLLQPQHEAQWSIIAGACVPAQQHQNQQEHREQQSPGADSPASLSPAGMRQRLMRLYRDILTPFAAFFAPAGGWRSFLSPLFRLCLAHERPMTRTALHGGITAPPRSSPVGAVVPRSTALVRVRCPHGAESGSSAQLLGAAGQAGAGLMLAQLWRTLRESNPLLDSDVAAAAVAHLTRGSAASTTPSSSSLSSSSSAAGPVSTTDRNALGAALVAMGPAAKELANAAAALLAKPDDPQGKRLLHKLANQAAAAVTLPAAATAGKRDTSSSSSSSSRRRLGRSRRGVTDLDAEAESDDADTQPTASAGGSGGKSAKDEDGELNASGGFAVDALLGDLSSLQQPQQRPAPQQLAAAAAAAFQWASGSPAAMMLSPGALAGPGFLPAPPGSAAGWPPAMAGGQWGASDTLPAAMGGFGPSGAWGSGQPRRPPLGRAGGIHGDDDDDDDEVDDSDEDEDDDDDLDEDEEARAIRRATSKRRRAAAAEDEDDEGQEGDNAAAPPSQRPRPPTADSGNTPANDDTPAHVRFALDHASDAAAAAVSASFRASAQQQQQQQQQPTTTMTTTTTTASSSSSSSGAAQASSQGSSK